MHDHACIAPFSRRRRGLLDHCLLADVVLERFVLDRMLDDVMPRFQSVAAVDRHLLRGSLAAGTVGTIVREDGLISISDGVDSDHRLANGHIA